MSNIHSTILYMHVYIVYVVTILLLHAYLCIYLHVYVIFVDIKLLPVLCIMHNIRGLQTYILKIKNYLSHI